MNIWTIIFLTFLQHPGAFRDIDALTLHTNPAVYKYVVEEKETVIEISVLTPDNAVDYAYRYRTLGNLPITLTNNDLVVSVEKDGYYVKQGEEVLEMNTYGSNK